MRIRVAQRILWLTIIILLLFSSLGYRLYDLQIRQGADLTRQAFSQRVQSLPLQMRRGLILDRNGVPLTDPQSGFGVAVFPRLVKEPAQVAAQLGEQIAGPVLAQIARSSDPAWVVEGLSQWEVARLQELDLPGIVVGPVGRRYGGGSLARHLVGYANLQGGQAGLERAFEWELAGNNVPHLVASFDGRGRSLSPAGVRVVKPQDPTSKEPYDLFTTIDLRLQKAVERELDRTAPPTGKELRAAVVILDPQSGDILALASRPDFEQTEVATGDQLRNRALTAYEPGSIFKPLVAAAALEEGLVSLDEEFTCTGHYELGGMKFGEFNKAVHGTLPFREAIARSCNVTFSQVGYERLGASQLLAIAGRFGLGRESGLPATLVDERPLPALRFGGDVVQFSFGQAGLMVTPLQMARAYAAIANGGILPPLRLVTAIKKPSGEVIARPGAEEGRRVISKETAQQLQEALAGVTAPQGKGTGKGAWVDGLGSAGKTGSAEAGGNRTHAWFAGWVPLQNPRYVIVVLIENGEAGGQYAAPVFKRIAEAILRN